MARCAFLALALLALTGCRAPAPTEARILERQRAMDPPQLWLAQVTGGPSAAAVFVCADDKVRQGLTTGRAEVNGTSCASIGNPVEKPGLYAQRCRADGVRYALHVTTEGDQARDFKVAFALQSLDGPAAVRQTRRYRLIGPCPAGWRIGDQARPGKRPAGNALGGSAGPAR
jgi:hypothetical protein